MALTIGQLDNLLTIGQLAYTVSSAVRIHTRFSLPNLCLINNDVFQLPAAVQWAATVVAVRPVQRGVQRPPRNPARRGHQQASLQHRRQAHRRPQEDQYLAS